jgi:hypothetical protein
MQDPNFVSHDGRFVQGRLRKNSVSVYRKDKAEKKRLIQILCTA